MLYLLALYAMAAISTFTFSSSCLNIEQKSCIGGKLYLSSSDNSVNIRFQNMHMTLHADYFSIESRKGHNN